MLSVSGFRPTTLCCHKTNSKVRVNFKSLEESHKDLETYTFLYLFYVENIFTEHSIEGLQLWHPFHSWMQSISGLNGTRESACCTRPGSILRVLVSVCVRGPSKRAGIANEQMHASPIALAQQSDCMCEAAFHWKELKCQPGNYQQ